MVDEKREDVVSENSRLNMIDKQKEAGKKPVSHPIESVKKLSLSEVKGKAIDEGLLSLSLAELATIAESFSLSVTGKKTDLANRIMCSKDNFKYFVLGKPIGYISPRKAIHGFKPGITYPVDREREVFFIKYKVR